MDTSIPQKYCPLCNAPQDNETLCKKCSNAKQRAYYAATREQRLARRREYRAGRMEQEREKDMQRHWRDREKRNAAKRAKLAEENADPVKREQRLTAQRAKYHANKARFVDKNRARLMDYYHNNKEKYAEYQRNNPLKINEKVMRRRAIKRAVTIGKVSYEHILQRDGNHCYICGGTIEPSHKIEFDHVIPLNRGGIHSEENIKVTHAVCNHRKNDLLLDEMTPYQRCGP